MEIGIVKFRSVLVLLHCIIAITSTWISEKHTWPVVEVLKYFLKI